jgi:hypothetical protein
LLLVPYMLAPARKLRRLVNLCSEARFVTRIE